MVLARKQFRKTYFVLSSIVVFGGLLVSCDHDRLKKSDPEHERIVLIKSQLPVIPPAIPSTGCPFGPGDLPQKTLSPDARIGRNLPVDHFVFVVQENRSFDHYFQDFRAVPGTTVDVAPNTYTAISPFNKHESLRPFELLHPCPDDPAHDYESVLLSWRGGKMDGFALAAGKDAVGYFSRQVLEYYHALARAFSLSDHHFADFLGPTWPNRFYMLSGTSFGHINNSPPPAQDIETSLFHQLDERRVSWRVYADSLTFEEGMYPVLHHTHPNNFRTIAQFKEDAKLGNLPAFAWVESSYGGTNATDEHPPANIEIGQLFVSQIVDCTMHGADWESTLLVLTYDEHGGFFDHVPPPAACRPDAQAAKIKPGHLHPRFDHLGLRVPLILVSPWVKRGYVSHVVTSHASLLRLVQARFELPALTRRDANTTPPFDMFDFNSSPRLDVPDLPTPRVEPSRRKNCEDAEARVPESSKSHVLSPHAK